MGYVTKKEILCEDTGKTFAVGQTVTVKTTNGGGMGGCCITKITDTGFQYHQGTGKNKSIRYENITEIY